MNVVINGREVEIDRMELTYDEIATLAYGERTGNATMVFTMTFSHRNGTGKNGILHRGQNIELGDRTIINVTVT